jgi:hypothetical protein
MKPDRPLILSLLFLAAGLGLIFGYCHGDSGLSAALPISGSSLHICITTTGAGALGGFALTVIGTLLLICAFCLAIAAQFRPSGSAADRPEPPKE